MNYVLNTKKGELLRIEKKRYLGVQVLLNEGYETEIDLLKSRLLRIGKQLS